MTRHLLHVGYPKTGSKVLQRWFAEHPQIAFDSDGIAGFRDVHAMTRAAAMQHQDVRCHVTSYEGFVAPRVDSEALLIDYEAARRLDLHAAQESVCAILRELFPNADVLIVTRGFRAMILSAYSQYLRSGGDATFEELTALRTDDPSRWNYDQLIATYTRAFGAERVLVLPYELLRDDADRFARIIEERLGLDHHAPPRERLNVSLSPAELYWIPRIIRTARRLPWRRAARLATRAASAKRLRIPIRVLERMHRDRRVTIDSIPAEVVEALRGRADSLRDDPLYAPYAADYLWSLS